MLKLPNTGFQEEYLSVEISTYEGIQFTDYSGNYSQFRFSDSNNNFIYGSTNYATDHNIYGDVYFPSGSEIGSWNLEVYNYLINDWMTVDENFDVIPLSPCHNWDIDYEDEYFLLNLKMILFSCVLAS